MSDGFWKPADVTVREEQQNDETAATTFNFSRAPLAQQRMLLPIYKHKRQILYSLENHGVVVIVGETGCGKYVHILNTLTFFVGKRYSHHPKL
jgi:ATP-dependent RNA helicase DDX35